ncbi:MAG: acyl-CoA thioesterase II [Gemmatimonadales bacterium]|nr:MAG: acyl-CoA thioesterase II [Gemmatimonadales bacterium]
MKNLVQQLLDHLTLERRGENLFRGESHDVGSPNVFGGQVLGQALVAASGTVADRRAHSLHAYFLLPGDKQAPIDYEVDRIRDGRSYATRRVVAVQHGRPIFNLSASFKTPEEGVAHQFEMPVVPAPESLLNTAELARQAARAPTRAVKFLTTERPIEFRPVAPSDPFAPQPSPPSRAFWIRARAPLPDDPILHQAMLAYASDFSLLATAMLPHALSFVLGTVHAASIDHAMWFHRDFRMDEWLLYAMDSPSSADGRGFSRGNLFSRDGRLVASVAQEGVIRRVR